MRNACLLVLCLAAGPALAQSAVTVTGDLQSELGCGSDFDPACAETAMTFGSDGVWRFDASVPVGTFGYVMTLDGGWDTQYGRGGVQGGDAVLLGLATGRNLRFYFRAPGGGAGAVVADAFNQRIVNAVGTFQSEAGCAGDWQPDCLRSWLTDMDEDGTYRARLALPAGEYEFKFAIDESWDENYGAGGVPGGLQMPLTVGDDCPRVEFVFESDTNVGSARCVSDLFADAFESAAGG